MTILNSCCYWHSLRKGCYVSGIYTLLYFGVSSVTISLFLYDERRYLSGESEAPEEMSFIGNTSTTVIFNMMLLLCASFGIFAALILLVGLTIDCRQLLLPWIITMIADAFVEASHFFYVIGFEKIKFKVLTAFIFTIDFFVVLLNVYCLLCVVSQYQEYRAGRGMRRDSFITVTDISFMPSNDQITSPHNMMQSKTSSLMCPHTNCNLQESPNANDMKYVDDIVPWNGQDLYGANHC